MLKKRTEKDGLATRIFKVLINTLISKALKIAADKVTDYLLTIEGQAQDKSILYHQSSATKTAVIIKL